MTLLKKCLLNTLYSSMKYLTNHRWGLFLTLVHFPLYLPSKTNQRRRSRSRSSGKVTKPRSMVMQETTVPVCETVCECVLNTKTIAHQIETDFTLYLLAPACDNRLDRKSNGRQRDNESRRGTRRRRRKRKKLDEEQKKTQITHMQTVWSLLCVGMLLLLDLSSDICEDLWKFLDFFFDIVDSTVQVYIFVCVCLGMNI